MNFLYRKYRLKEEIFNSVTHGIGTLLSVAGCVVLIVICAVNVNTVGVVASSIYGSSLILLYLMSTLYHAISNEKAKKVFKILDHNMIFVLIAGTYTPITLCVMKGWLGWTIFGVVWAAAIVGIVLSSINLKKFSKISTVCYLIMGWGIIFAIKPLVNSVSMLSIVFLLGGGIFYSIGTAFYVQKEQPYRHSVWHLFVLFGSVMHYFSVLEALK